MNDRFVREWNHAMMMHAMGHVRTHSRGAVMAQDEGEEIVLVAVDLLAKQLVQKVHHEHVATRSQVPIHRQDLPPLAKTMPANHRWCRSDYPSAQAFPDTSLARNHFDAMMYLHASQIHAAGHHTLQTSSMSACSLTDFRSNLAIRLCHCDWPW